VLGSADGPSSLAVSNGVRWGACSALVAAMSHFPELKIELEVLGFGCSTNLTEDEAGALWIRVHVCNALIFKKIRIL
jgi:hypothetical protein